MTQQGIQTKKVAIIGAGIVGAAIARVLSKYENLEVHIFERNADVGWGASKANSAIVHPGHEEDPEKHPLRAKLCAKGNRLWHIWSKELEVPTRWPGELMVAFDDEEIEVARHYLELGEKNGVPGIRLVYGEELRALEPNINPSAVGALWAPTAGVMAPWEGVIALIENAVDNGAKLHTEVEVKKVVTERGRVKGIDTSEGFFEADIVINAAGLYADKISKSVGIDFDITPRKGEYYLFEDDAFPKVTRIVHQTPTPKTKGVYLSVTIEGSLLIGPTAEDLPKEAKEDTSTTREGLDFVWEWAGKLVASLPPKNRVMKTFAGLRPEPPDGKWIIEAYDNPFGFINAAGMRSPALTSAPAIAEYIDKELIQGKLGIKPVEKKFWNPYRKGIRRFRELSDDGKNALISLNPKYGNVICMCKEVTEAEIIEAIERMQKIGIKTITLDGIKFRTLSMFGWCQGSFCRIRVAKIVSEKLGIPVWDVSIKSKKLSYGIGNVKTFFISSKGDDINAKLEI
ncbi:MAG: NAD(P)/FAD-dependent oxidoreductase [Synergistetes bacterium]|nr:NAD(P)/FAD-dependent oxidoreductase [Synergistota bacterium]